MNERMKKEQEFLKQYDSSQFEKPSLAVDVLIFTIVDDTLKVVMIKRDEYPFMDCLALPGVFVGMEESLEDAAKRGVKKETGLSDIHFEQLYTWGDVKRDPRMRIISVSYLAPVVYEQLCEKSEDGKIDEYLYSVDDILNGEMEIAFDHREMIAYARDYIRKTVEDSDIAFNFVQERFTLPRLQKIYEILLGKDLYKANFRKKISVMVKETQDYTTGDAHRPSKIYVKNDEN